MISLRGPVHGRLPQCPVPGPTGDYRTHTMSNVAAFFDLDGTLTTGHVWRGISRYIRLNRVNLGVYYRFLLFHMALWAASNVGLMTREHFTEMWTRDMAMLLKGYSWEQARELFFWVNELEVKPNFRPLVLEALRWHLENDHVVVLVSGAFQELLDLVAEELGVSHSVGTVLTFSGGLYTGRVTGDACFGAEKARRIRAYLRQQELQVNLKVSYAYADRVYDTPWMEMVGHPVATYPDKYLLRRARSRGWGVLP